MLVAGHALLAEAMKTPEFALTPIEADTLAGSIGKVLKLYDIGMTAKAVAYSELIMACGGIYGPRLALVALKKKAAQQQAKPSAPVHPFINPKGNGNGAVFHGTIPPA